MELDRLKRRISRVKGVTTSPETVHLIQQKKALMAQLDQVQHRRKSLAKQALKVQVSYTRSALCYYAAVPEAALS